MEDELGTTLFERSVSGSVPTESARELLKYWKACRLQLEDLEQKINEISNLSRGSVRIATAEGFVPDLQQQVILPFSDIHPNIQFTVEVLSVSEIVEAVADGICHIGVAFNPPASQRLVSIADVAIPLRLAVRPQHPLASHQGPLSVRKAFAYPLAMLTGSYGIRRLLDHVAYSEQTPLIPAITTNSLHLAVEYALNTNVGTFIDPFHISDHLNSGRLPSFKVEHPLLDSGRASVLIRAGQTLPTAAREIVDWILYKSKASRSVSSR
nr:LysR substrate-binding domain-containing protein [Mesorhizobium sp.]